MRSMLTAAVAVLTLGCALAPGASAHTGAASCKGELKEVGSTWEGSCEMPFQGFPIGIAGVFDSEPLDPTHAGNKAAEIHLELLAQPASGPPRPIGVECEQITTGVARCQTEYNPFGAPLTLPEELPSDIVAITCSGHSHAKYTRLAPPAGRFACWSSAEARAALAQEGWFADNGFESGGPGPGPDPEPQPGPLSGLSGSGVSSQILTVPFNTYAPSTVVVSRSLGLTYTNVDTARHDVVALDAKRPDGSAPWCDGYDPGGCPLFWSKLIAGNGTQTPVLGLPDAKAGESYTFFCSIHPYMTGTIEVVE